MHFLLESSVPAKEARAELVKSRSQKQSEVSTQGFLGGLLSQIPYLTSLEKGVYPGPSVRGKREVSGLNRERRSHLPIHRGLQSSAVPWV